MSHLYVHDQVLRAVKELFTRIVFFYREQFEEKQNVLDILQPRCETHSRSVADSNFTNFWSVLGPNLGECIWVYIRM